MDYLDFEVEIAAGGHSSVVRSPAGEASGRVELPFDASGLGDRLRAIHVALLSSGLSRRRGVSEAQPVEQLGRELWDALFTGDVRARLDSSIAEADRRHVGLRVKLQSSDFALAGLPWEFLYDPRRGRFLSLATGTSIVRYVRVARSIEPLSLTPPLRILGMVGTPTDLPPLDASRERGLLERAVEDLAKSGLTQLTWVEGGTWRDLLRILGREPWHVLHFVGYAGSDRAGRDSGALHDRGVVLAGEGGTSRLLSATDLGRLLADKDSLRLVVLRLISGGSDAWDDSARLGEEVVRRGTPAVVATQYEMTDEAVLTFDRELYSSIASGWPVDASVADARRAIWLLHPGTFEWGVPAVFTSVPDGAIFRLPSAAGRVSPTEPAIDSAAEVEAERMRLPAAEAELVEAERRRREAADGAAAAQPPTPGLTCPHCGYPNEPGRRFCSRCAFDLEIPLPARVEDPQQAPVGGPPLGLPSIFDALAGLFRRKGTPATSRADKAPRPSGFRVERHTSATFPSEVEAGAEATLAFSIGDVFPRGTTGTVSFVAPLGVTSVELVATVHAPAFEIVIPAAPPGGGSPRIALPLNVMDPTWAVEGEFRLRAKSTHEPVNTTVLLDFWYRRQPVGQTRIPTRVVPRGQAGVTNEAVQASAGEFRVSDAAAPAADVTLYITDEGGGRYLIQASTRNVFMRNLGAFPTGQNAWTYASAMLDRFRDAADLPETSRLDRVVGLGLDLWGNLPVAFQRFYWDELYGRDVSIAIYSQEPYIPWELIRPPADGDRTPGFVGLDFRLARWRNGRLFPDPLVVRDFAVIAPTYIDEPLEETALEAADLASRFGARVVDGEYGPVAASLRSPAVQLVHFAGHGAYDETAPQQSRIRLSDQALLPTDVRTFRQGLERGPFVFLNACEVGEQGWVFTGIGGWADTFCDVGCAGFVGPYWAVDDQVARVAAVRFYDGLAAGKTVGEAIRQVRRAFDEPGPYVHHPTWLAYSLHCQPNIRITLKRQPGGQ